MCLINKHKKYQYLYLREKISAYSSDYNNYEIGHYCFLPIFNRLDFYSDWLDRINKKYNYA